MIKIWHNTHSAFQVKEEQVLGTTSFQSRETTILYLLLRSHLVWLIRLFAVRRFSKIKLDLSLFCSVTLTFCVGIISIQSEVPRKNCINYTHTHTKKCIRCVKVLRTNQSVFEEKEAGATVKVELCQKPEATHFKPCAVKRLSPLVAK